MKEWETKRLPCRKNRFWVRNILVRFRLDCFDFGMLKDMLPRNVEEAHGCCN